MSNPLIDALDELGAMLTDHGRSLQGSVVASLWQQHREEWLEIEKKAALWDKHLAAAEHEGAAKRAEQNRRDDVGWAKR